ncbi:hypothetical protein [Rhizomonospora bruguierae]|uniref:hypothetical protein n=1 Tax=Rhizomonospora bruguierae TaxID=1581705 RepID=UPI001BCBD3CD|nr:hypothetical protein [Micromonospora sp. NBRC 107566]
MRPIRLLAALVAALAMLALPTAAHAATVIDNFAADSGDACHYGATSGTLVWRYGAISPLPGAGVDLKGQVTDRPLLADPGISCRDDGYYSTATFTAYAGNVAVDQQSYSANNAIVTFGFTLGTNSAVARIDRVVVQVCRSPLITLPPSYCGRAVTYLAPPTA